MASVRESAASHEMRVIWHALVDNAGRHGTGAMTGVAMDQSEIDSFCVARDEYETNK